MEREAIKKTFGQPVTVKSIVLGLKEIGVKPGMTLLVHSSLSSLGWVCGGPVAVIVALEEALTEDGTLAMPAHSCDLSDPAHWCNPPVPKNWWPIIRDEMPPFDNTLTPTRGMGKISETFRKQNGVLRSNHPAASFSAWGKNKEFVLQDYHPDFSQNELSPLGRIYELDGYILFMGVDYDKNTSFHLAEYKANYNGKRTIHDGFPITDNGVRKWYESTDILYYSDDFIRIGRDFEQSNTIQKHKIGNAACKLISQRKLVDYAVAWMESNRNL